MPSPDDLHMFPYHCRLLQYPGSGILFPAPVCGSSVQSALPPYPDCPLHTPKDDLFHPDTVFWNSGTAQIPESQAPDCCETGKPACHTNKLDRQFLFFALPQSVPDPSPSAY